LRQSTRGRRFGSVCKKASDDGFTVTSSDGRKFIVKTLDKQKSVPQWIYPPNAPGYLIEYTPESETLERCIKRVFRAGRATELSYFPQNFPNAAIRGRIKALRTQSVGKYGVADRYKFTYAPKFDRKGNPLGGSTTVVDANGCRTRYEYSSDMRIKKVVRSCGLSEQFGWCEGNLRFRLFSLRDKTLLKRTYGYDFKRKGNLEKETIWGIVTGFSDDLEPIVKSRTYFNDLFNNLASFDDGNTVTRYLYKAGTALCSAELTTYEGRILRRKFYRYDDNAILIEEIEDDGRTENPKDKEHVRTRKITRYTPKKEEPGLGLPIEVKHLYWDSRTREERLLSREVNTYSREGWLTRKEVYNSDNDFCYTLFWEYNQYGQAIKEVDALGHVTLKHYNEVGDLIHETNPKGFVTVYDYDYSQRPIRKEFFGEGIHTVEKTGYNVMGQITERTDIYGCKTTFEIDIFGREVKQTLSLSSGEKPIIEKAYDAFGNLTLIKDAEGNEAKTSYNCLHKPLEVTHPDGEQESFRYNLQGQPVLHIAKNGTETRTEYDCFQRPVRKTVTSADGKLLTEETLDYDAFNLISRTDAEGRVTTFEYDGAGRKIAESTGDRKKTFHYDKLGRQSAERVWRSDFEFTATVKIYDYAGRAVETRIEDESETIFSQTLFDYDDLGRLIRQTQLIDGMESTTEWSYDALGEVTQMIDPEGNITRIAYNRGFINEQGQTVLQKTTTAPNGILTIETFDVYHNIASVEVHDQKLIAKTENQYDKNNRCYCCGCFRLGFRYYYSRRTVGIRT